MQAVRLTGWGRSPELVDVPVPEPTPGSVLVRVGGAGICGSDIHVLDADADRYPNWEPPFTLGHETAGWVSAHGDGVDGPEVGTPVAVYGAWGCGYCRQCAVGAENYCTTVAPRSPVGGLGRDGGMAEFVVVPASRLLVPLPDTLSPRAAAPLTDAGLTAYHAVAQARDRLRPGAVAIVIGAGGLGHMAVQILKATSPVRVVAVDRREEALTLALDCGADEALRTAEVAGLRADVVLDFVGTDDTLSLAAGAVAKAGHVGLVGAGGGALHVSQRSTPFGTRLTPTYWGTRGDLHDVLALAASGSVAVHGEEFPLERACEAYEAVRGGRVAGRATVVPDESAVA